MLSSHVDIGPFSGRVIRRAIHDDGGGQTRARTRREPQLGIVVCDDVRRAHAWVARFVAQSLYVSVVYV